MAKDFAKRLYKSRAWENVRQAVIDRSRGLCEECLKRGELTPGRIVHHKTPLTPENIDDPAIALDPGMCEYVCKECHEEIHARLGEGALPGRGDHGRARIGFDEYGNVVRR